jgi:hypothetical protein
MNISRVLIAELLKLKRTLALRLTIFSPLVLVILVFGIYLEREQGGDGLRGFAQLILTLWTIILFPFYAALVASLLAAMEHQNEGWKRLFVLPVSRGTIFAAKWITGFCLLLVSSLVVATGVCAAAEVLHLARPIFRSVPLPVMMIFRGTTVSFGAAGLLFSIQMWISLRWRNFLPGLVVAVLALVMMFIFIPHGAGLFGDFFPWSLPAMAMAPNSSSSSRLVALGVGILGGVTVGTIACRDLARLEFF